MKIFQCKRAILPMLFLVIGIIDHGADEASAQAQQEKQSWSLGIRTGKFFKGLGIEVVDVVSGSPAKKVGIRVGDYLHSIGGSVPTRESDFSKLLRTEPSSKGEVVLHWLREDEDAKNGVVEFKKRVQLESKTKTTEKTGTLGIRTGKFVEGFGIEVVKVIPGSPAKKAGIRVGDYLHSISGSVPTRESDFATLLRTEASSSGEVVLHWVREDEDAKNGLAEFKKRVKLSGSAKSKPKTGVLGIRTGKFVKGFGIEVVEVIQGSPAEYAGFRAGDYLYSIGGSIPTKASDYATLMRTEPSSTGVVVLRWFRKNKSGTTDVIQYKKKVKLNK